MKSLLQLPEVGLNLTSLEKDLLRQALERAEGNRTQAGILLGLNRDQVRHRIKKWPELRKVGGVPQVPGGGS